MNISKTKVKDQNFIYNINEVVLLARRNKNGHPKKLEFDIKYMVYTINNDILTLINYPMETYNVSNPFSQQRTFFKVHKSYLIPYNYSREIKIIEILNGET